MTRLERPIKQALTLMDKHCVTSLTRLNWRESLFIPLPLESLFTFYKEKKNTFLEVSSASNVSSGTSSCWVNKAQMSVVKVRKGGV